LKRGADPSNPDFARAIGVAIDMSTGNGKKEIADAEFEQY
jgi:hypothetical protein